MVTESIVVILLTMVISFIYLRRGKRGMAACVLPVAVLPVVTLLGSVLQNNLLQNSLMTSGQWRLLFVVAGLLAGGTLLGIISANIHKKAARRLYLFLCGGFTILFAFSEILAILG